MLLCYFNSIKVRLEPSAGSAVEGASDRFQFHKGTIRTILINWVFIKYLNFNSIKVRLERCIRRICELIAKLFQFHKGTIRTYLLATSIGATQQFQFHKGTIRTVVCATSGSHTDISIP